MVVTLERIGLKLLPLNERLRRQNKMPENAQGVYIADVKKDTPAARAGLRPVGSHR